MAKTLAASAVIGVVAFAILGALESTGAADLWGVLAPTAAAGAVYIVLLRVLRVREAEQVWQMVLFFLRTRAIMDTAESRTCPE